MATSAPGTRWQYRTVSTSSMNAPEQLGMTLAVFGQTGWELAVVYDKTVNFMQGFEYGMLVFKRPVPAGTEPEGPWSEVWTFGQVKHAYEHLTSPSPPPPPPGVVPAAR